MTSTLNSWSWFICCGDFAAWNKCLSAINVWKAFEIYNPARILTQIFFLKSHDSKKLCAPGDSHRTHQQNLQRLLDTALTMPYRYQLFLWRTTASNYTYVVAGCSWLRAPQKAINNSFVTALSRRDLTYSATDHGPSCAMTLSFISSIYLTWSQHSDSASHLPSVCLLLVNSKGQCQFKKLNIPPEAGTWIKLVLTESFILSFTHHKTFSP